MSRLGLWLCSLVLLHPAFARGADDPPAPGDNPLRTQVNETLAQATRYFHQRVARHGGYVYHVSRDGKVRWGEGKVGPDTIFVQPPATPTVGLAYLDAWEVTADEVHRTATLEAARALMAGQLESGGWTQTIDFPPHPRAAKRLARYRVNPAGDWNASSLDDGQSTTALRFLMRLDVHLHTGQRERVKEVHEAAQYGLDSLFGAQFPNGAFPQVWTGPVLQGPWADLRLDEPARLDRKARYPDQPAKDAPRVKNYWDCYTLNDDLPGAMFETLVEAERWETATRVPPEKLRARQALERLARFLRLARMPEPQPAWCQQYHPDMFPIWARKFEPPAIACSESEDAIRTLIRIARITHDESYLQGMERTLEYLGTCVLPDGRYARFRELRTNRPLYMDGEYRLTYDDASAPSHYGWKRDVHLAALRKELAAARREIEQSKQPTGEPDPAKKGNGPSSELTKKVRRLVDDLVKSGQEEGCWVSKYRGESLAGGAKFEQGTEYLSSALFCQNMATLSEYLKECASAEGFERP
jgi:hypothetical protein